MGFGSFVKAVEPPSKLYSIMNLYKCILLILTGGRISSVVMLAQLIDFGYVHVVV